MAVVSGGFLFGAYSFARVCGQTFNGARIMLRPSPV